MRRNSAGRARNDIDCEVPLDPNTPISVCIVREEDLERDSCKEDAGRVRDSTFGVQSLADTIHDTFAPKRTDKSEGDPDSDEGPYGGRRRSTLRPTPFPPMKDSARGSLEEANMCTADSSPSRSAQEGPLPPSLSRSLTSLSLDSQAPLSSLPSTPKSTSNRSFRHSDDESQAVVSSEEDEAELPTDTQGNASQLVMPTIKLPRRRPFTSEGKAMGRLKVLIAGDTGVGKTSLIKSIVQLCEDIVHVDPLSPKTPSFEKQSFGRTNSKQEAFRVKATQQITEVYASTKPYPSWYAHIEGLEDVVLDRNLCFVEISGCNQGMLRGENIRNVSQYMESQLIKPFSALTANEGDIAGLLSGKGGSQVDVVFYLVAQVLEDEDVAFLQRLTAISNVIPLVAKSDLQSFEEIEVLKRSIIDLQDSDVNFFSFGSTIQSYTVCSETADDDENMDASTLMSPEYVQPLIPSELANLVHLIFNPDNMACLRHLSAKKLVQAQGSRIFSIPDQSCLTNSPTSPISSPNTSRTLVRHGGLSPYTYARISDHMQQEERLGQIRLAKWASDLQRSLRNERARYEAIARGERAVWLTERLGETVNEGALVPIDSKKPRAANLDIWKAAGHRGLLDAGDPLGLLRWNEVVKRKVWIIPIGLLGVIWMFRTWGEGSHGYTPWSWGWSA